MEGKAGARTSSTVAAIHRSRETMKVERKPKRSPAKPQPITTWGITRIKADKPTTNLDPTPASDPDDDPDDDLDLDDDLDSDFEPDPARDPQPHPQA